MIIEALRVPLIPGVIALTELGAPYITPRGYSDYWLYAELFSSTCRVALDGGRVVGIALGFRSQDAPEDLYVQDVMTHPDHRRRGVTRGLVDELREQAWELGCRRLYLTSKPGNSAAHKTWERLGFTNIRGDSFIDGVSLITDYKGPGQTRAVYELVREG
ncbi:GNAT family N-acetyltransferase [Nocardia sp. KC 131]|uniref:GNAT family N-acetyltransferase n=1 Tax=Nocardia arseniciresistens TaxID=3392119 RepID=UPI00398EFC0D